MNQRNPRPFRLKRSRAWELGPEDRKFAESLDPETQAWLRDFNAAWHDGDVRPGNRFRTQTEFRKLCFNRNNLQNRDAMSVASRLPEESRQCEEW